MRAGNLEPSDLVAPTRNIVVARVVNANIATGGIAADRPRPLVPVNRSVTRNHIICLDDGKELRMLRRYLRTRYHMSPEQYRMRWGLAGGGRTG